MKKLVLIVILFVTADCWADENAEQPVNIAVSGQGIHTVVTVPSKSAGTGPHTGRLEDKEEDKSKPEEVKVRGRATDTISYGTGTSTGGTVRVRIPGGK